MRDAAFYDSATLRALDQVRWITRVPASLKESKGWLNTADADLNWVAIDTNYAATTQTFTHNGLRQRWVLLKSRDAYKRELATCYKRFDKSYVTLNNALWHLSNQVFSCEMDANKALQAVLKKNQYFDVASSILPIETYLTKGRPAKGGPTTIVGYQVSYQIATSIEQVESHKQPLGRFILGTNQLDETALTAADILSQYKEQSQVESGFKFIKDNAFELSRIFLKTPRRISALMMIMTLCLMVYNVAQFPIRNCLDEFDDVLPNQHGKPSNKPTMKWIAERMVVIFLVTIYHEDTTQRILPNVANVNQVHRKIIAYFGEHALKMYGLPPDYRQEKIDYAQYKNFLNWCEV